ncbi:hypothetical protein SAMN05216503_2800 [Polaribacter sp. KT25b]|uniref:hypothetical protein n=1 Tax=Polaribacter sp. KT25b TaxID=1855336 RepID=UPI00087951F7|nr:hypothetical protein [Polaribacter sp. KT25b]SDS35698.1 hypothetical protein SAMN05216503_2800 [Polaribacter sp. KT25b]
MKKICFLLLLAFSMFFFSCSEDSDITTPRNLEAYVASISNKELGEVTAFAASTGESNSYIYYYPEEGATDIRYYEADSLNIDETDFSKYRRKELTITDVFGGKLESFSRSDSEDNWCLVTYMLDGKLHKSDPIHLKNETSLTGWTDVATIKYPETLTPNFTWSDFGISGNTIYFEAISRTEDDEFISGTFTYDKVFNYFDSSNIVKNINVPETPDDLEEDTEYLFTMMAISDDNWVNLVIQKTFMLKNLQEYLDDNSEKTIETGTAFAASSSSSESLSYIYYYPLLGFSEMRYYETESLTVDENDFSNYRRKDLTDAAAFGGKLRRFSRTDDEESWGIVTFVVDEVLYKSNPIKIKNVTKPTEWFTDVTIEYPESLNPKFTWLDGTYLDSSTYFQVITDSESSFLSGTFTTEKTFQYNNNSNVTSTINLETPETLILDDEYKFTLMGISDDNWVNLVIQESFIVE